MVDSLRVDTKALVEAGAALRVVAEEFAAANDRSEAVADAVGHPALAGALRSFADNWDNRRAKMLADIAGLAKATTETGAGFEEVDRKLGAALRGEDT